jgi:uncharacterized membrane protein affecting hemolysin expression
MQKNLKVRTINFERRLTFNEWVEKYKVSSAYVEPTKYFQGNAGSPRITMDTKMEFISPRKSSADQKTNLLGKLMSLISF